MLWIIQERAENWQRQNKGNDDQTARWLEYVKNRTRTMGHDLREL